MDAWKAQILIHKDQAMEKHGVKPYFNPQLLIHHLSNEEQTQFVASISCIV